MIIVIRNYWQNNSHSALVFYRGSFCQKKFSEIRARWKKTAFMVTDINHLSDLKDDDVIVIIIIIIIFTWVDILVGLQDTWKIKNKCNQITTPNKIKIGMHFVFRWIFWAHPVAIKSRPSHLLILQKSYHVNFIDIQNFPENVQISFCLFRFFFCYPKAY